MRSRRGVSLVEVMIALVLLGVGVLGGLGSIALAWRTALNGERLAASARRSSTVIDSLEASLAAAGGRCAAVGSGRDSAGSGTLAWSAVPAGGGISLTLDARYATIPASGDSGWTWLRCEP